jgi:hypothetical protein
MPWEKGAISFGGFVDFFSSDLTFGLEGGGSGNVFGYNYSKDPQGRQVANTPNNWLFTDISTHGWHPFMNLWEGNIAARVSLDNMHGSSSHNTLFRNWIERRSNPPDWPAGVSGGRNAVTLMMYNIEENLVGNILCHNGCTGVYEQYPPPSSGTILNSGYKCDNTSGTRDPAPGATLLKSGNFDYINNATNWDPNIPDRSLPNSLYLTSKPAFFGALAWPAIGPDLNPMAGTIPAKQRYDAMQGGADTLAPAAPTNLTVQ